MLHATARLLLVAAVMAGASELTDLATRGAQTAQKSCFMFRCRVCRQVADWRDKDMTVIYGGRDDRHF
ncbi:hypothetical protein [Mycetohabitans sp. B4]|uniref:hypothetical protein n=1 Tax=Mycetohabitans sp. B4 TaxID=2841842 RepID=UPI000975CBA2|nr:hypothetical protein [Mycetohabitans sp. B4]MCG1019739.1 hypothetical protein [Mycetohabitans sp. B4]